MIEIDRRSLIGIAGASLVVGGCRGGAGNDANSGQSQSVNMLAPCEDYGQLVGDTEPSVIKKGSKTFAAQAVCCVYIKFEATGVSVRHAYVEVASGSKKDAWYRAGKALFQAIESNEYKDVAVVRVEDNFNNFSFSKPQLIMFFIDNDPKFADFDDTHPNADGKRREDHIIRFTPRGSKRPEQVRQRNHAFLNLQPVDYVSIDDTAWPFSSNKSGYALEYWNIDDEGKYIDYVETGKEKTHYLYSMNIHLKVAPLTLAVPNNAPKPSPTSASTFIPMVLDPDTGNMGGDP
jgi:hypothetical protein